LRRIVIGAHLRAEDIVAGESIAVGDLFLSAVAVDEHRGVADSAFVEEVARLRQALIAQEIFVALRYGTTVSSESDAKEKCGPSLARWKELLERWRGFVEVTMKIAPTSEASRPARTEATSGADYLRRLDAMRRSEVDETTRAAIDEVFAFAAESKWTRRADGGWERAALIRRAELTELERIASTLRNIDGIPPFLLSGPWPLEAFAE
jgi:hypothetical protein